jgi:hypothetical protein
MARGRRSPFVAPIDDPIRINGTLHASLFAITVSP